MTERRRLPAAASRKGWEMPVEEFISNKPGLSRERRADVARLWAWFSQAALADQHFVTELTSRDSGKFDERVWEMELAKRLATAGHELSSDDEGPDIGLNWNGIKTWVEAVMPRPEGLPEGWLAPLPERGEVRPVPFCAIMLRWTTAIDAKYRKLVGRTRVDSGGRERFQPGYHQSELVGANDAYVIAVDPSRLGTPPMNLDCGMSRYPIAVEAVLPFGPWAIVVNEDRAIRGYRMSTRVSVLNRNNAPVPTDSFLNRDYSGVSAVAARATDPATAEAMTMIVVHNPYADRQLSTGLFGGPAVEYVPRWAIGRRCICAPSFPPPPYLASAHKPSSAR